jgi:hypothetical protein
MITLKLLAAMALIAGAAAERSPDDWFALVAGIERDVAELDAAHVWILNLEAEDRKFIRKMANELTVSADTKPTAAQGQWLLSIRSWIDAAKERKRP